MNLLDQLTNFCQSPITINLLQFPNNDPLPSANIPKRHSSLMNIERHHDNRQTKSIEKMKIWAPSNKQQMKQKILIKFVRTLSNKIRKHHYNFWINFQKTANDLKDKSKANKVENIKVGLQALNNFISAYTTKYLQGSSLTISFSQLKKFKDTKIIQMSLINAISPAIRRQQSMVLREINERERNQIKLDVFCNFINLNVIQKLKSQFFLLIKYMQHKSNTLSPQLTKKQSYKSQEAKKVVIKVSTLKNILYQTIKFDCSIQQTVQEKQVSSKPFFKLAIDLCIQNQPQICDNNLIFIEKPHEKRKNFNTTEQSEKQNKNICNELLNLKTKRLHTKPQNFESRVKNHNSYIQDSSKKNSTQLITPRHRNITSYSPFNIDEARIQKLQKKIFGETNKKQSRFSVNGEDWKNDKKALMEIMCNIKSPLKVKRHSVYSINGQSMLNAKLQNSQSKQNYEQKEKGRGKQCIQKENSIQKGLILKSLFSSDVKQVRQKYESKILVSLKLKKKQSSQTINCNKGRISRKLSQQQISLKKSQIPLKQLLV